MYWDSNRTRTVSAWFAAACLPLGIGACGDAKTGTCATDPNVTLNADSLGADVRADTVGTVATTDSGPDDTAPSDTAPTNPTNVSDTTATDTDNPETDTTSCPWEGWNDGLIGGRVDLVAFDPRNPGTAWAGSGQSLSRSGDGGLTWELRSTDAALSSLQFPSDDPKALIGGGVLGVFASHDGGRSFDSLALSGLGISALLVHPANAQRIFVGTLGAGVLRSNDGGVSFSPINVGVPRANILAFAAPPDDADLVIAGLVAQSDALGPEGTGALLRSTDGGLHWTTVSTDVVWGNSITFCPSNSARVIAAVRRGVLASDDRGATWHKLPVLADQDVLSVAFAGGTCDRIYASVYQHGVYRIDDDGQSSVGPLVTGFDLELGRFTATLAAHPTDRAIVLAATTAGLYRSGDAGQHWQLMNVGSGMMTADVAAGGGRAYLATWGSGLWERTAEAPWTRVRAVPRDFVQVATVDPSDGERVAVGTVPEPWFTTNGGEDFTPASAGPANLLTTLWLADGTLLAGSQVAGVLRSSDGGAHWTPSNQGLVASQTPNGLFIDVRALILDPTTPGRVYAALLYGGVAHSDDLGLHWVQPADSLRDEQVSRLVLDLDPASGAPILYALASGKGIYRSTDRGATWQTNQDGTGGLPTNLLGDLVLDPSTHTLYVTAPGMPVFKSQDGLQFAPFDGYCEPPGAGTGLAIFEDEDGARWLVAVGNEHVVVRHRL